MKEKKIHLFDKPKNVNRLIMFTFGACIILLIIDFLVHKHSHFSMEEWPAFYATFGFVAYVSFVLTGKYGLRKIVKRREEYYD